MEIHISWFEPSADLRLGVRKTVLPRFATSTILNYSFSF